MAILALAFAARCSAQVTAGEASLNLTGNLSGGYSDNYSNVYGSDHSIAGAGQADLSGSYHNPNFLSFDVQPFYNQSRLNSTFQSITASSGVNASAKFFGGSNFPGSITYSNTFNSSGNFGIPGLADFTTHGNNDTLGVNWGVHLENLPTLNIGFSTGNNSYSVYGANTQGRLHSNMFSATSAYQIAGFNLNGGYQHTGSNIVTPEFLTGEVPQHSNSGSNSLFFGVGHALPWDGSFSANATRSSIGTDFGDATYRNRYDTTIDTLTGSLNFAPMPHLNVGGSTYYTDNLEGTLYNTLLGAGVPVPQFATQQSSTDLSLTGYANYEMPAQHLNLHGFVEREQQNFWGMSLASNVYNATASYSNTVLGGSFNGVVGVTRTSINTTNQTLTGLNGSLNYIHEIGRWNVSGGISYSQATQTILIAYTSSGYNYTTSLGRRLGRRSYWGAYVSGAKSLLTDQPGTANSSHSYTTSLSLSKFSINGSYSTSNGNALLTPTGLVPTPVPLPIVNPLGVVLYNGKSYAVGVASNPTRGLTLSASFAKALSGTQSSVLSSSNNNENMDFRLIYNFRKMSVTSGYNRLLQGFSFTGTPPALVGSFYVGISRWFNFF
ncbi:MAG: hypothetical protein LAP13_07835 [Acidobacteriia bacterium]|nr:hypothetical protein [Terriglobia bacterium]